MPTGYTAGVADGSVTEFSKFAMECARAFGALMNMRDEPQGANIPDKFETSGYHDRELAAAKARQRDLALMTSQQVEIAAEAAHEVETAEKRRRDLANEEQRSRYLAMRAQAAAWVPPSKDHSGLHEFMLQQLDQSIDFDCRPEPLEALSKLTPQEWFAKQIERNDWELAYHTEKADEERKRCMERTVWVRQLRKSLGALP
ncbi:MAG: hypothetical protein ACRYGA_02135 [Janthinobacterium lividum]